MNNNTTNFWPDDDGYNNNEDLRMFDQLQNMGFATDTEVASTIKKKHKTVYLAGPMEVDLDSKEKSQTPSALLKPYSVLWREQFTSLLEADPYNVWDIRNPTDNKLNEAGCYEISPENSLYYNPKVIVSTDKQNVLDCDYFVANFIQEEGLRLGTPVEFGWADIMDKFIIIIADKNSKLLLHPFITLADIILNSVEEAAEFLQIFPRADENW